MEHLKSNAYSHLTAKERTKLSFPARFLLNKGLLQGNVLDYGCGLGSDVSLLKDQNIQIDGYDKHYLPDSPTQKYDTIICLYVLNVLLPAEQAEVLMDVSRLLKPGGKAYFAVRRDLKHQGYRIHKVHKKPTYQCIVKLNFPSILHNDYCEIYEYQHIHQRVKDVKNSCPFCYPESARELIVESATAYSIFDKYPVSEGHALVIPKRHVSRYFELSFREQSACWFMMNRVQSIIGEMFSPEGFNLGININKVAGQTIDHAHIHLIPRYSGDVPEPMGGVRGVIPNKQKY